jgi:hypothetical protein
MFKSVMGLTIVNERFCGFPQSLQANAVIMTATNRLLPHPFKLAVCGFISFATFQLKVGR